MTTAIMLFCGMCVVVMLTTDNGCRNRLGIDVSAPGKGWAVGKRVADRVVVIGCV